MTEILQSIDDNHLRPFAAQLTEWLIADLNKSDEPVPDFTESRAKALLRAADAADVPTLDDFARLVENETAVRLALYDLLQESELADSDQLPVISNQSPVSQYFDFAQHKSQVSWLALSIAAFAWKSGYPLHQLDPASPPEPYSPAGQVLKRAAHWLRQQVQRSATDRDKLGRKLAFEEGKDTAPASTTLQSEGTIAPFATSRPPVPVRYRKWREKRYVEPDESVTPTPVVGRPCHHYQRRFGTGTIIITANTDTPIRIERDQVPPPPSRCSAAATPPVIYQLCSRRAPPI
ncbi:MAG: hypothetical protein H6669_11555 [Ardenticatenaceae bacterium]|nr:hypothetical protein [Ardenticatenaceae bacterium]